MPSAAPSDARRIHEGAHPSNPQGTRHPGRGIIRQRTSVPIDGAFGWTHTFAAALYPSTVLAGLLLAAVGVLEADHFLRYALRVVVQAILLASSLEVVTYTVYLGVGGDAERRSVTLAAVTVVSFSLTTTTAVDLMVEISGRLAMTFGVVGLSVWPVALAVDVFSRYAPGRER